MERRLRDISFRNRVLAAFWLAPLTVLALVLGWDMAENFAVMDGHRPFFRIFLSAMVGVFGLGGLYVHRVTGRFTHAVSRMAAAAEAVGRGEWERRLPAPEAPELAKLAGAVNWMAERVHAHMADITTQKDKLEAVLDGMWDGVMVLDRAGRIQSMNRAMEGILPEGGQQLAQGRKPLEALASPELQDLCDRLLGGGDKCAGSLQVEVGQGRVYEVNAVRPLDRAPGLGLVLVFHDVSEFKRLEAVRRDFAANVSHELRTPLTAIKGYAETLLGDPPPPPDTARHFMGVILRNADHMSKMARDMLSLSRLEAGERPAQLAPMNPAQALATAWEAVQAMATARKATLDDQLGAAPTRVLADGDQLVQLFRNLLENAVKFGPEGAVVRVSARREAGYVEFEVRDQGPGIPRKDQSRIFERFYSVQKHRRNEFGSTGLGLAICRHVVRNLGGEIRVQRPPEGCDTGTSFFFTLPAAE